MYITIELLKDEQGNNFFAIGNKQLGKFKPIGNTKVISKGNVLISDMIEAIGKEDILKYIDK